MNMVKNKELMECLEKLKRIKHLYMITYDMNRVRTQQIEAGKEIKVLLGINDEEKMVFKI